MPSPSASPAHVVVQVEAASSQSVLVHAAAVGHAVAPFVVQPVIVTDVPKLSRSTDVQPSLQSGTPSASASAAQLFVQVDAASSQSLAPTHAAAAAHAVTPLVV